MKQKDIFLKSEGNKWLERNAEFLNKKDLSKDFIVKLFKEYDLKGHVLEIGCADGFRLAYLEKNFKVKCTGIEPSLEAVNRGKERGINIYQGTADNDLMPNQYDVIIFGFCLYLCDRDQLFKIAYEADKALKKGGYIIIQDFYPPYPYSNKYSHFEGILSHKMRYEEMFLWNPSYTRILSKVMNHDEGNDISNPDNRMGISLIFKQ